MAPQWVESFVQCLNSGRIINNRLEEAISIKDLHLPKKIYKYRCDNVNSRSNLTNDSMWLASPDKYNDPYDCSFKIAQAEVLVELKKTMLKEFAAIYNLDDEEVSRVMTDALKSDEDPLIIVGNYIASKRGERPGNNPAKVALFNADQASKMISDSIALVRQFRSTNKICSFSAANDNILMWSHYANHHKGFCIEYDFAKVGPEEAIRRNLYPVIYSPGLYDMTPFMHGLVSRERADFPVNGPLLSVLHKYEGWSYEQEWRVIFFVPTISPDHPFTVPRPSRVFLGSMMDETTAREIAQICADKGIAVLRMKMAPDHFKLLSQPYSAQSIA